MKKGFFYALNQQAEDIESLRKDGNTISQFVIHYQ
jgi:hypothetical protein